MSLLRAKTMLLAMQRKLWLELHQRASTAVKAASMVGMLLLLGDAKSSIKYGLVYQMLCVAYTVGCLNYVFNYLADILLRKELRSHKAVNYGPITISRPCSSWRS